MGNFEKEIEKAFFVIALRACVYYYFTDDCKQNEISESAFKQAKEIAMKYITEKTCPQDEEQALCVLREAVLKKRIDFFINTNEYKRDADFMIKISKQIN